MILQIGQTIVLGLLITATYIDIKRRIIPNKLVLTIGMVGVFELVCTIIKENGLTDVFIDLLIEKSVGILVSLLVCLMSSLISKGGLGMGDVKLLLALGFTLGLTCFVKVIFLTSVISVVSAMIFVITHGLKVKDTLPFAPFVMLGVGFVYLSDFVFREMIK